MHCTSVRALSTEVVRNLRKIDPQGDDVHWSQVFLHYIEVGGEYDPEWRYDKNPKMFNGG